MILFCKDFPLLQLHETVVKACWVARENSRVKCAIEGSKNVAKYEMTLWIKHVIESNGLSQSKVQVLASLMKTFISERAFNFGIWFAIGLIEFIDVNFFLIAKFAITKLPNKFSDGRFRQCAISHEFIRCLFWTFLSQAACNY